MIYDRLWKPNILAPFTVFLTGYFWSGYSVRPVTFDQNCKMYIWKKSKMEHFWEVSVHLEVYKYTFDIYFDVLEDSIF